jgi:hypothetical protein
VDDSHAFDLKRWRRWFRSEASIRDEALAEGRAPDATVDEVGPAPPGKGFDGRDRPTPPSNGPGWGYPGVGG